MGWECTTRSRCDARSRSRALANLGAIAEARLQLDGNAARNAQTQMQASVKAQRNGMLARAAQRWGRRLQCSGQRELRGAARTARWQRDSRARCVIRQGRDLANQHGCLYIHLPLQPTTYKLAQLRHVRAHLHDPKNPAHESHGRFRAARLTAGALTAAGLDAALAGMDGRARVHAIIHCLHDKGNQVQCVAERHESQYHVLEETWQCHTPRYVFPKHWSASDVI